MSYRCNFFPPLYHLSFFLFFVMPTLSIFFVFLFLFFWNPDRSALAATSVLSRRLVPRETWPLAACLDGTAPSYYVAPSSSPSRDWVIYIQGGGWCSSLAACHDRSRTAWGSSRYQAATWQPSDPTHWFLSDNPAVNPMMHEWNRLYIPYCDGGSFSGLRTDPVTYLGTRLYFRGHHNLMAIFGDVVRQHGKMRHVALFGGSAGGLSVLLHGDKLARNFLSSEFVDRRMAIVSMAGFFIEPPVGKKAPDFKWIHRTMNSSAALRPECLRLHSAEPWRCFWPQHFARFITSQTFAVQSRYDKYQIENLLNSSSPISIAAYGQRMSLIMQTSFFAHRPGRHGIFLHSSFTHGPEIWPSKTIYGQNFRDIFGRWFFRPDNPGNLFLYDVPHPCPAPCNGN